MFVSVLISSFIVLPPFAVSVNSVVAQNEAQQTEEEGVKFAGCRYRAGRGQSKVKEKHKPLGNVIARFILDTLIDIAHRLVL